MYKKEEGMNTQFFALDPMAGISYGLYNSAKKGKGSYEDFLLHYNSKEANDGNNNWLTKMIGQDTLTNLQTSNIFLSKLNQVGISTASLLDQNSFLSTKATAYKLQLMQEMQKRGYTSNQTKALTTQTTFTNPLLS